MVAFLTFATAWYIAMIAFRPWPIPTFGISGARTYNGIAALQAFFDDLDTITYFIFVPALPSITLAVILRFRRAQGIERVQMKWPLLATFCFLVLGVLLTLFPALGFVDARYDYPLARSMALLFPASIGAGLVAAGITALLFQPLHQRLQRAANRLFMAIATIRLLSSCAWRTS